MPPMFSSMKFKGSAALPPGPAATAKKPDVIEITPLQKMLQTAGPIKPDGTDKFFGMENFGNTCYCNSIMQALFYSIPFRDHVVKYPPHSPVDTPNGHEPTSKPAVRVLSSSTTAPVKTKGLSAAEAMKRRQAINAAQPVPGTPGTRPEDKPDSPEYKKKHAMLAGPILELTYENATSYGMEESTFTAMKDIFMALITTQVSRTGVLSPQRFLEIFKRDNEMFRTSMHQDAHEFYGLVLNAVITNVEDNAKRIRELAPKLDTGIAASMGNAIANAASALGLPSGSRSPGTGWVHDIFEGVLTSETKCLTCETASQRDETFLDLSIDLEQHSSVTSCLRKFSAEEMLCERNKFHCDNCGGLQEAEKRMKIKQLPKILTLHLKRFKYTEDMTRLQKLFHRVVYPYHLRMFNTTDDAEDPDRLYELYAVVVHIGGNAYHGHYVSIIKTQDRGWLLFDDEMVEPVDKHYVRNFFGDKPGQACAYVLFYQETTFEAVQKEQEAEGLAEVALASQEAGIALGQPQPNGTHPSSTSKRISTPLTPTTPIDEHDTLPSLDHAMTAPSPLSPHGRPLVPMLTTPLPAQDRTRLDSKTKEEREREKRESKEAEKARKAADKERAKAEEKARKDAEQKRKDYAKTQAEELRATMAASKASAAAEEERRRKEVEIAASKAAVVPTSTAEMNEKKENGLSKGLSLHRNGKTSKSVSGRKGFGGLFKSETNSDMTAVEGDVGPQTPEKNEKAGKDRFSFSLGKKKSHLFSAT